MDDTREPPLRSLRGRLLLWLLGLLTAVAALAGIGAYVLDLLASGTCAMKADAPWIKTPQTAHFIDSGTMVINQASLTSYKDDLKKITADIQGKFKATYMTCK